MKIRNYTPEKLYSYKCQTAEVVTNVKNINNDNVRLSVVEVCLPIIKHTSTTLSLTQVSLLSLTQVSLLSLTYVSLIISFTIVKI
jgi:hypothetical protein